MSDESSGNAPQIRSTAEAGTQKKIAEVNQQFKERNLHQQAKTSGKKYIDLQKIPINHDAIRLTDWDAVEKAKSLPFHLVGQQIYIASVDPELEEAQDFVKLFKEKGYDVDQFLCSQEGINASQKLFEQFLNKETVEVETKVEEDKKIEADQWSALFEKDKEVWETGTGPEMHNKLNLAMVQTHVSDVHLQPQEHEVQLRMRADGVLHDIATMSHKQFQLLDGEIKRAAGLKINVKDVPQDGQYSFVANERKVNIRVSSLPAEFGQSLVLRVLDQKQINFNLEGLGFTPQQQQMIEKALQRDHGLLLTTGPTGSGKSSTLYSCLTSVNDPEKKIITLEDPIEYELPNIIQSEISVAKDYTFASGLRAILRHDPDIIMVGEIRDQETAEIALQASMTGHLVLSTFHANDALSTLNRLIHLGIRPYILTSGLEVIVAQRLVRKYTGKNEGMEKLSELEKERVQLLIESLRKKGIPEENLQMQMEKPVNPQYEGRTVVAEVLELTDEMKAAILDGKEHEELEHLANEQGFFTIQEIALLNVIQGNTTLQEVWKILI